MKKNNKGFTLVELIVVLVILAILAAILVPALLGWIDKAREKSMTTNAEAALVATQGKVTEAYGNYANPKSFTFADVNTLADIDDPGASITYKMVNSGWKSKSVTYTKSMYQIKEFTYTPGSKSQNNGKKAYWTNTDGNWEVK